jgi:hypothetical protein
MQFIFMLTVNDRTIDNAIEVLEMVAPLGLRHIGFKDVGADLETLRLINGKIKVSGADSYLEVVATSRAAALNSARMAVEIGVDHLLGGTLVEETLEILNGSGIGYYPFPGNPSGHPTKLGGTAEKIAADTERFLALGCAGVDLLAYRATEAEPVELIRAAREALGPMGKLICAGDVDSPARIAELRAAGASHFTVGSAAIQLAFCEAPTLVGQLEGILACL